MNPIMEHITVLGKTNAFSYLYDTFDVPVVLNVPLLSVDCTTVGYISFHRFQSGSHTSNCYINIVGR